MDHIYLSKRFLNLLIAAGSVVTLLLSSCAPQAVPVTSGQPSPAAPTQVKPAPTSLPATLTPTSTAASAQPNTATPSAQTAGQKAGSGTPVNGNFEVNGHSLYLACLGTGSPTIVLETGEGGRVSDMLDFQTMLAKRAKTCAYDRASTGSLRTAKEVIADLHALLAAAQVPGPYLLVGQSAGGLFVQLYARTFPDQVAGVVAMNPVPPAHPWLDQVRQVFTAQEFSDEKAYYQGQNGESFDYLTSSEQLAAAPKPPSVPFEMLISTNAQCENSTGPCMKSYSIYEQILRQAAADWPRGNFSQVAAGHEIYLDHPDAVMAVVERVLSSAGLSATAGGTAASTAQPNDAAQARLRLGTFVYGGPNVDLYVNGQIAVNGGQAQVDIPAGYINGYLFLAPGTYQVAVTPTGKGLDQALIGPVAVTLVAGHRYTLTMMGQLQDKVLKPLVIDETTEMQKVRTSPTQNIVTVVNNLSGTKTIDFGRGGSGPHGVPYLGFGTASRPVGVQKSIIIFADGDPKNHIDGEEGGNDSDPPAKDSLVGFFGSYPGEMGQTLDVAESEPSSDLNLLDFLQAFHAANFVENGQPVTFDTFLSAVKTAGLTDLLTHGGPFLVLPPTDAAFAALPKDQLAGLLKDPQALGNLLRNHIVAAYVPRGALAKTPGGPFDRTFTNLLGQPLTIGDGYSVNGQDIGEWESFFIANGTQVHPSNTVLLPTAPSSTPTALQP